MERKRQWARWAVATAVGAAGCLLIFPTPGRAATPEGSAHDPGKGLYLKYCSACHGESGKGDGVVSGLMRPKPTDLTQLAKKSGGQFPFVQVMETIDGSKTVRAHGDPDMPVWGQLFREEAGVPLDGQVEVKGKLLLITEYLRSIQEK